MTKLCQSLVKETKSGVDPVVKDGQHELAVIIASIDYVVEELKSKNVKDEAELAAAQAEKMTPSFKTFSSCDDEDGALLLETPHCLESSNLLESSAGRSRTKRVRMQGPTCYNNPSSSEDQHIAVHKHPRLSKLKPPSRSDGFSTKHSSLLTLKWKSGKLISDIKEADDADDMIDMSSDAFTSLDALRVDYTPLYKAVYSVVSHQCDKEALVTQKLNSDFVIKAAQDQAALEFSKEEERRTNNNRALKEAEDDINELTDEIKLLSRMLKKAERKKAEAEAKAAAARAEGISSGEACDKAKQKLDELAQKSIDEFETKWKETVDGLELAMEELSRLESSL